LEWEGEIMSLPLDFQFSQGGLQDFQDCRRRFQLRYLLHRSWPAVPSEPLLEMERYMLQGARFHRLLQQHRLGIPVERLTPLAQEQDLSHWWESYLNFSQGGGLHALAGAEARYYPELTLTAPLGAFRLLAKLDLLAVTSQGHALILDWKTSRKRPRRQWLADRLQTRVYPYLLIQAGAFLNAGKPFEPQQVEMVYWFANFPDQPERFPYSTSAFQADRDYLVEMAATIGRLTPDDFSLTSDVRHCAYCVYRSLCERGDEAGSLAGFDALQDEIPLLDFDQTLEIEY
jgi:CRISPR/Cas system-associated exonuclease Cas4 (RecB family)